jgi:hypothetical protein
MTDLVSSISSKLSTSLILGALLPTTVYVLLSLVLLIPLFPGGWSPIQIASALDTIWVILAISLVVMLLSGLLYNLNIPIIRLFEGYPWRDTRLGQKLVNMYYNKFEAAKARQQGLRVLMAPENKSDAQAVLQQWRNKQSSIANNDYPDRRAMILPTRLGNIIASFEAYPRLQYGMDGVILWPRLFAKIDPAYADAIDGTKTAFDFMLNCSVLSTLLSVSMLFYGLFYGLPLHSWTSGLLWFVEIVVLCMLAALCYMGSINRARAWGNTFKSAFDLYRWDLLKQLGYASAPATMEEEREMWRNISRQMLYGDSPEKTLAYYNIAQAAARSFPPMSEYLHLTRSVRIRPDGKVVVILHTRNAASRQKERDLVAKKARDVTVMDTVPAEFDFVMGSAFNLDTKQCIAVAGANPYEFEIGDLPPGDVVKIAYVIAPRKSD